MNRVQWAELEGECGVGRARTPACVMATTSHSARATTHLHLQRSPQEGLLRHQVVTVTFPKEHWVVT